MKTDIEISNEAKLKPISTIATGLGIDKNSIEPYGKYAAKVPLSYVNEDKIKDSKLILVTSMSPTKTGIGKTTVSIGLSMGLNKAGKKSIVALREPSLGPCFGVKGGACGGGYSQVLPMDKINLHFTGDFHAVTSAHNMITALMDNYLYQHDIKLKQVLWKRVLDVNDRSLREIITGIGSSVNGGLKNSGFDITAASEIMAILCLSKNYNDLAERIDNILLGYKEDGSEFIFKELGCTGAIVALLKDAFLPNLVQTIEGTPAIIHGGPFANIAHGCSSVVGTQLACSLADYVVTEAGFGSDLGAEKFLDIKCPVLGKYPNLIVVVTTISGLKLQGGCKEEYLYNDYGWREHLNKGFANLDRHVTNMQKFVQNVVVVCNKYPTDTDEELETLFGHCCNLKVPFAVCNSFEEGSKGANDLAKMVVYEIENGSTMYHAEAIYSTRVQSGVMEMLPNKDDYRYIDVPIHTFKERIENICKYIYGASNVVYSQNAEKILFKLQSNKYYWKFPICIAKTQYSFTDNPNKIGAPVDFTINIDNIIINRGAGMIVALTENITRMPGLPLHPIAENIKFENEQITGLV